MFFKTASLSSLQMLAAQWRLLGMIAVAFSRQLLQFERSGDRRTYRRAQMLEAWLCAALGELTQQLGDQDAAPTSPEDGIARRYLHTVFCMLTTLLYFSRALQHRVRGLGRAVYSSICRDVPSLLQVLPHSQRYAYLDSS